MKLGNIDVYARSGETDYCKPYRPYKAVQLSGNRIRLTAGAGWSACIVGPTLPLGTLSLEFECRAACLDPWAVLSVWRFGNLGEYDDFEWGLFGDTFRIAPLRSAIWDEEAIKTLKPTASVGSRGSFGRRFKLLTIETATDYRTIIEEAWERDEVDLKGNPTGARIHEWRELHRSQLVKPYGYVPGEFKVGLWVPKKTGLMYPLPASAPLSVVVSNCVFTASDAPSRSNRYLTDKGKSIVSKVLNEVVPKNLEQDKITEQSWQTRSASAAREDREA